MKKLGRHLFIKLIFVSFCLLLSYFLPFAAAGSDGIAIAADNAAADNSAVNHDKRRKVRLAFVESKRFMEKAPENDKRRSGYGYEYLQNIAYYANWRYEYIDCTFAEAAAKLQNGETDIVLVAPPHTFDTESLAATMLPVKSSGGSIDFYIAVADSPPEILAEFSAAQQKLSHSTPDLAANLKERHFKKTIERPEIDESEWLWATHHGAIRIGYIEDFLPVCDIDKKTGELKGMLRLFLDSVQINFGLRFEYVPFKDYDEMYKAAREHQICAFCPIYDCFWMSEEAGFMQTDNFVDLPIEIVVKNTTDDFDYDDFAILKTSRMQLAFIQDYFPKARWTVYDNFDKCFEAVANGEVEGAIINSFRLSRVRNAFLNYPSLDIIHLTEKVRLAIGVKYDGHDKLLSIFNKALTLADKNILLSSLVRNSTVPPAFSPLRFFREYSMYIVGLILFIAGAFILVIETRLREEKKAKLEADAAKQKAEQLNEKLEALLEREKMTQAAMHEAFDAANMANEAKTNFLANMSHDIRTPMNAIIGMTAIAGTHIEDKERVAYCLSKITSSSKHLLGLINEVLDMSKIEAGKLELSIDDFNLSDLIDNVITITRPLAEEKHHNFEISLGDVTHELVSGDGQRLQQVLLNLLSNAVKYTPDGGSVAFGITEKISNTPQIGCYEFVIADNGIGMDEDFLPHVFEPFARAKNGHTDKIVGTGLGLSIAKSIVQMMNGDIKVESSKGKGSKFTVTIYLRLRDADDDVDYSEFNDLPVLVVDDDLMTCEIACNMLKSLGMTGEYVLSGSEAVAIVSLRHSDGKDFFAVIIDWKMPEMDGIETTREIRRRLGDAIPIIIISAYDWTDIEQEARKAGANAFISKPLFKSRLVHVFHELAAHNAPGAAGSEAPTLHSLRDNDFSGRRALLVEDNELNAEIATEILKMAGLVIEWATDGKEALDMVEKAADDYYDIIFMDIQMPVMDGYASSQAIRSLPRDYPKRVPIVAMTANAFAQDVIAAKNAGMNEHIAKPIDIAQLNVVLKKWLK